MNTEHKAIQKLINWLDAIRVDYTEINICSVLDYAKELQSPSTPPNQTVEDAAKEYKTAKEILDKHCQPSNYGWLTEDSVLKAIQYALQQQPTEKVMKNIEAKYNEWCKETKRGGAVLIGGSIREFFKWLESDPPV